jgi:hypothetical protein
MTNFLFTKKNIAFDYLSSEFLIESVLISNIYNYIIDFFSFRKTKVKSIFDECPRYSYSLIPISTSFESTGLISADIFL